MRIKCLDGIRGVAIIMVLLTHLRLGVVNPFPFHSAAAGVELFFLLSAFLLSNYFFEDISLAYDRKIWVNFFFKRVIRIIPIYFFALFIYFIFNVLITNDKILIESLIFNAGEGHFWTMPVEFKFYFVFPFIILPCAWLIQRGQKNLIYIIISFLIILHQIILSSNIFSWFSLVRPSISTVFGVYLPVFLIGICVSLFNNEFENKLKSSRLSYDAIAAILFIIIILSTVDLFPIIGEFYIFYSILWGIILLVTSNASAMRSFFEFPPLVYLGKISFSVYLFHFLIYIWVANNITKNFYEYSVIVLFASIVIGSLIYYFIETKLSKITSGADRKRNLKKDIILPFIILISPLVIISSMPQTIAHDAGTQYFEEIQGNITVGQTFLAPYSNLEAIEIGFGTYKRVNTKEVIFHLRSAPSSSTDIYTINLSADKIRNYDFHRFSFDPIKDSKGRSFYFFIESPNSTPGNAITICYNKEDAYKEGQAYENGLPLTGDLAFRTLFSRGFSI